MSEVDTSFFNRVQDTFDIGNRMGTTDYIDFLSQMKYQKML